MRYNNLISEDVAGRSRLENEKGIVLTAMFA